MSLFSTMKSQEASSSNSRHPYDMFQEPSPSNCGHPYDVFLSFRGKDTRKAFTGHLYNALDIAGFRTFRDDDEVEKGEEITCELERAIRESRMSIIVFSKSYASSTWCLDELVMILTKRRTSRHEVLPVFYDVDPSDVRKQKDSFKDAFTSHETGERKDELKDKVGPWRAALTEVAGLAGMDLSQAEGCGFYTMVGIQTLMDRCLLSIDEHSKLLKMHQLLQEMGRQILHDRESSKALGERIILWNQDALNVLNEKTGTDKVEGLTLHMGLCKEDKNGSTDFDANRKRHYGEFLGQPFLANFCRSLKRYGFNIFSSCLEATGPETSNQVAFEADAFGRMHKLKFLKLQGVHINGPYKMLPKGLKWLRWNGFLLNSIPSDFPLENLTALDMSHSSLKNVWEGTRFLELLKILNLSHSPDLVRTPDFSGIPNLERLFLHDCKSLVEVHESIGSLDRLVLLDLRDCKSLRKLPRSIGRLKHLESLYLSGCPNLDELPTNTGSMDSQSPSANGEVNAMQSFKIEPIENVAAEITKSLGLSNLQSIGKQNVKISTRYGMNQRKLPLQGCHERHIFSAYLPGSNVPEWFSFKNLGGSSVDFTVPSNPNSRVRGLSICSVYELSCAPHDYHWKGDQHTIVSNKTKGLVWSHCPGVFGVGEAGEDMMWLSYWKYGKRLLEAGDELRVSLFGGPRVQVKEVGVRVLYNEEQEAEHRAIRGNAPMEELPEVAKISRSSQSDINEENVSRQTYDQFGNIIPESVPAHPRTKLYQLGLHGDRCEYCQQMYPKPWIATMSYKDWIWDTKDWFWDTDRWAPALLMLPSYYVSDPLMAEEDLAQQEMSHYRAMYCKTIAFGGPCKGVLLCSHMLRSRRTILT